MDIGNCNDIKTAAKTSLTQSAYPPKKLILIHSGLMLLINLLLSVVNYFLQQQIGAAGGLGGLGLRSALTTAQTVLGICQTLILPFWQIGYIFAVLRISRQKAVDPSDLTEGFRLFRPVLRLELFKALIYTGLCVIASYAASTIFLLTPLSNRLMQDLSPILSNNAQAQDPAALQQLLLDTMGKHSPTILIVFGIVLLAVITPAFYRYRMAEFLLLDHPRQGALYALRTSRKLMRHRCMSMFRLDVSFWWFYLLEAVIVGISYGDFLLEAAGVTVPVAPELLSLLLLAFSLLCRLGLHLWQKNEVNVSYAHFYNNLLASQEAYQAPTEERP